MLHELFSAEAIEASEGITFFLMFLGFLRGLFPGHQWNVLESLSNVNPDPDFCQTSFKMSLSSDVYTALEKQGYSSETAKRAAGELTTEKEILRKQKGQRWYMLLPEHLYEFE